MTLSPETPFVVIGSPDDKRVTSFQAALTGLGYAPAHVVSYLDIINGRVTLPDVVTAGAVVRIESPGKDFASNQALTALGAQHRLDNGLATAITPQQARQMPFDKGRMGYPGLWYAGFCAFLERVQTQLDACPPHRLMNHPHDIALMFDKRACYTHLATAGISVPPTLDPITSFGELEAAMRSHDMPRVFVKLAHGSSAVGIVAYRTQGARHHAATTVEMVTQGDDIRLYNTRRIRHLHDYAEIARLIDALCQHEVHVQKWMPKARLGSQHFDLRVLVIAGSAAHTVARLSHNPMTNLHLLNDRITGDEVRQAIGDTGWHIARQTAVAADALFGRSLYAGVDVLLTPRMDTAYVLEVNAFGDLLLQSTYEGVDAYTLAIQRLV